MENQEMSFVAGIPTLDIKAFTDGTQDERTQFVRDLGNAYESIGFVAIHGHGIEDVLIEGLYAQSQAFFSLSTEQKRAYARPETNNQRGFVSMGMSINQWCSTEPCMARDVHTAQDKRFPKRITCPHSILK